MKEFLSLPWIKSQEKDEILSGRQPALWGLGFTAAHNDLLDY